MAYQQGSKLYLAGRDLSGDWTVINLTVGREQFDNTVGSDSTRVSAAGRLTVSLEAEGAITLGTDEVEGVLFEALDSLSDTPIVATPPGSTAGDDGTAAYGFEANVGDYSPFNGGTVGSRLEWSASARAAGRPVRGTIMYSANSAISATANGTARQLGAVASGQKLYACIQVVGASGTTPTLDAVVASDDNENFTSGTTRATFTQKTDAGQYEWVEVAGPITDDWWRVELTLGGTSPSFNVCVLLAIH